MHNNVPKSLSRAKLDALRAIARYRRQRRVGKGWIVGDKRLSASLIARLEADTMVKEISLSGTPVLVVTEGGRHELKGSRLADGPRSSRRPSR
ncbi:hypothetical protein LVY75_34970 (plasmid) [Sinorhizobium sp. B11]